MWGMLHRAAPAALLLAALALAYANSFAGGFQFDDFNVVLREPGAHSPAAWWRSQPGIRPLLKLSYALNNASGLGLPGFHAVNLALHAAAVLLVHVLLRQLAQQLGEPRAGRRAAFIAALVFALHPVQTEAVTYICGRSTALAALCALAAAVLWQRGRQLGRPWCVHLASPLAMAVGLACKEYVAVLPLALLLLARLGAVDTRMPRDALRDLRAHAGLLALAALAAFAVPRYRELLAASLAARPPEAQLLTQAQALAYLAGQLMRIDRLNADPALPVVTQPDIAGLLLAAAWLALPLLALRAWRHARLAAFALLWFLVWLAPTQTLLPRLDVANDRQLYLALIGPAFALAYSAARQASAHMLNALALVLALGLGVATAQRNAVYRDEVRFWADVAAKAPHNARAFANLGHALAEDCRLDEARAATEVALGLDPRQPQARLRLALWRSGPWPDARCTARSPQHLAMRREEVRHRAPIDDAAVRYSPHSTAQGI